MRTSAPHLCLRFRYFALRKMHFLLRCRALVAFRGGIGTLDELFVALTLEDIEAHHLHHADRQGDGEMVEALIDPVVNGTIGKQARKTHFAEHGVGFYSGTVLVRSMR